MANKLKIAQPSLSNKWRLLTRSTDLVFLLYNNRDKGGLENPAKELGHRKSEQASPQSLASLKKEGLIVDMEGRWELDQMIVDFIDALAGIGGEANVQTIQGNRINLSTHIQHYLDAKQDGTDTERYFKLIRNDLQKILRNIRGCLEGVDFTIKDTYTSETNLNLKSQILKENREILDTLEKETRDPSCGIYAFIEQHPAFNDENDERMRTLKTAFLWSFSRFYGSRKSAIVRRIGEYLDRIEKVDKPARKIQIIYELYSKNQLRSLSNLVKHDAYYLPQIQKPRSLSLSLERDLYPDDNPVIPVAVRDLNLETGEVVIEAPVVSRDVMLKQPPKSVAYNFLAEVRRVFASFEKDASPDTLLAEFIIGYEGFERELNFRERVMFFLEVVNQFRTRVTIMDTSTEYISGEDSYWCIDVIKKQK